MSPQQHYDWGLRALKTVLKGGGALLQPFLTKDERSESCLIVQALRLNTLSKLTFHDAQLFDALVKDVFPDVTFRDVVYERLESALKESCTESNLSVINAQVGLYLVL